MKRLMIAALALAVGAPLLMAQDRGDLERGERAQRVEQLRQQVMERVLGNYIHEAQLSEEQANAFRSVIERHYLARREQEEMERQVWHALEGQMRPGLAADVDSLNVLLDAAVNLGVAKAAAMRSLQAELTDVLTPVQRAQFVLRWQRFQRQVEMVRMRAMGGRQGEGPPRMGRGDRVFPPGEPGPDRR